MPPDPTATRDKLLDAAAALFAERGVANVSLAEIVRAADQRNTSALHYHFGGRDQVVEAILARHVPILRERRLALLATAQAAPADDVRSVAEALVRRVTELAQRGWRERAYLQIGAELAGQLDRTTPEMRHQFRQTAGPEVMALLADRCAVPDDVWRARALVGNAFVGRAAADWARALDRGRPEDTLPDDRWVANLVDMFIAMMTAPVTP
ncbi:MAG TPA: TetR/AcrR family transcriptional regulator [Acidimicrobiales bacterium]